MKDRIKELRQLLGLTQSEFANRIAMNQTGISMVEKGTRELTDRQIITICAVFGVHEEWLRNGVGDMYPAPSDEDAEIMELMAILTSDDTDPRKKSISAALVRIILDLPSDSLDVFQTIFRTLSDALDAKKDED